MANITNYTETLNTSDRAGYFRKLVLSDGHQLPDPYTILTEQWVVDKSKWPSVTWPDIYNYLIQTPSVYTKENLKAYKSIDAYNYVLCGHVRNVKYYDSGTEFCVLRADVLPSQRLGIKSKPYDAWVYVHKDLGYILTANCSCMAGLASCCSHAAAIMYLVEMTGRTNYSEEVACTSMPNQWKKSRKNAEPQKLKLINFSRPKVNMTRLPQLQRPLPVQNVPAITTEDLQSLKIACPDAAVFTSINTDADSDTDTASETEYELPEPLTAMFDPSARQLTSVELKVKCKASFDKMISGYTESGLEYLEDVTKEQSKCATWNTHRAGRITASTFHKVVTCKDSSSQTVVRQIMQYEAKELTVPAVVWGKKMEDTAREHYLTERKKTHINFTLKKVGLIVKADEPYLAASPDGAFSCDCCKAGVLEIKCPYKFRDGLQGSECDASFCLAENYCLRRSHPYYAQIQLQMHVCQKDICDFMVWTKTTSIICRINRDEPFLQENLPKAKFFFMEYLLPELICHYQDPQLAEEIRCLHCKRPSFGKMIKCTDCFQMFHCACVNITRCSKTWKCGCKDM